MSTSAESKGTWAAYPGGQVLMCDTCGAEIAIVKPCLGQPPDQVLQCCGKDMRPAPVEPAEDLWDS